MTFRYPSLINCTTIDYFTPWPEDALMAVAHKFMDDVSFDVGEDDSADHDPAADRSKSPVAEVNATPPPHTHTHTHIPPSPPHTHTHTHAY
jgi:hypothetical protein